MAEFVRVAALADIKPGQGIVAEANGKALAVFNVDGTIHAITLSRAPGMDGGTT
jgi:nitrite reductase (NADH) small subunit